MPICEMTAMDFFGVQMLALALAFFATLAFKEFARAKEARERWMFIAGLVFMVGLPVALGLSALQGP